MVRHRQVKLCFIASKFFLKLVAISVIFLTPVEMSFIYKTQR